MRQALSLLAAVAVCVCVCLPATAWAQQPVTLHATLTPERLGQSTTIGFGFQIATTPNLTPSPLTEVDVRYPVDLGFALSELGLATCSVVVLEVFGPQGCPTNSQMGYGTALAEIPVGPIIISETARITIVRTTEQNGYLALLFYAEGGTPVDAQIVFAGTLLPAPAPFGGLLHMSVPLVPSLPGAPDVAIVQLQATLGPEHLTYSERVHGRMVYYQPKGIPLPYSCPHGGFPFAAQFSFQDGGHASAASNVLCPHGTHKSKGRQRDSGSRR